MSEQSTIENPTAPVKDELSDALAGPLTPARRHEEVLTLTTVLPLEQHQLWELLTEPELLASWSPVVPDRPLQLAGPATSQENPGDEPVDATVIESRGPWYLEHHWGPDVVGWQLAPSGEGTQLNLVLQLSRPEQALDMAAGWHICLTVLRMRAEGARVGRCVGPDALAAGWDDLRARYAEVIPDPEPEQD